MSEQFSVFDEWGNKVGEYTPTGAGFGDAILVIIAVALLWTVGFVVYLLLKLVTKGFVAAKENDWGTAILYWGIPGILVFSFAISLIAGAVGARAQERYRQEAEAERRQAEQQALSQLHQDLSTLITMTSVERMRQDDIEGLDFNPFFLDEDIYVVFEITNNWAGKIRLRIASPALGISCWNLSYDMDPGETERYVCKDNTAQLSESNNDVVPRGRYDEVAQDLCIEFEFLGDPSGLISDQDLPTIGICRDIPRDVFFPMSSEEDLAHQLILIQEAELIQHRVFDSRCDTGTMSWCSNVDGIRYVVVNNWTQAVSFFPGRYYLSERMYGLGSRSSRIVLEPGQSVTVYQFLNFVSRCIEIETEGLPTWNLCRPDYTN